MKGRVDYRGWLEVKRDVEWTQQFCIHDHNRHCGTDCPAFDISGIEQRLDGNLFKGLILHCCPRNNLIAIE